MVAACPYPTTQGSQVYIGGLTESLVRRGHQVHVVTYHFGEDIPGAGSAIHRIPDVPGYRKFRAGPDLRKPVLDALLARTLLQTVQKHDIQIIHAHNYEAPLAGYLVRAMTGVPVVYSSHNTMGEELHLYYQSPWARRGAQWLGRQLDGEIPKRADHCLVLAEDARPVLEAMGVSPERVSVLSPGVLLEQFPKCSQEDARRSLGLSQGCPLVLYTGNPDRYQDIDLLLSAFATVKRSLPNARLVLVSHSTLEDYRSQAEALKGGVELRVEAGFERMREYLWAADVFAIPRGACSGFPIKLLNAMAAGLPVVATEASAKAVLHEETGLVVPNGDSSAMAQALLRVLTNEAWRLGLGKRAREVVEARYTWDAVAVSLEGVYGRVVGRSSPRVR